MRKKPCNEENEMRLSIFILTLICLSMITVAEPVHDSQAATNKSTKQHLAGSRVRTVQGIIQDVTNDSIQVRGKYYSISGVILIDPSGEHLKQSSLVSGKKVEIFFEKGNMTSILIYEDMVE